jgi:hypothetical protein
MLDIGFQNLSRLLASGKPIRVMVLDTQVYSNTGGQASTAPSPGQVADMSPFGKAQHGKTEVRKELALIAMAHRGTYVLQSSQASAVAPDRRRDPGPEDAAARRSSTSTRPARWSTACPTSGRRTPPSWRWRAAPSPS